MSRLQIPDQIWAIAKRLQQAGFTCYVVGGALRDALLEKTPKDWDLATNARPEQLLVLFPNAAAAQPEFGRLLVDGVDVMTLRRDGVYLDGRHPAAVHFCESIEDDLSRRDFTVNALAFDPFAERWFDPHGGVNDVHLRLLRVVGDPRERFAEDHLRMLRAVRFKATLGFSLDPGAVSAIRQQASALHKVAPERIRHELDLILLSDAVKSAFDDLLAYRLLAAVLPEIGSAVGCRRKDDDLFSHCTLAAQLAPRRLPVRFAALLHDVGKAVGRGEGHASASADNADQALQRLGYSGRLRRRVVQLVEAHMFLYPSETTLGCMRRMVLQLGVEGVEDLLELRWADRQASGRRGMGRHAERALDHLRRVQSDGSAISLSQLAISGEQIMTALGVEAGPLVGHILRCLHETVLDDPQLNQLDLLLGLLPAIAATWTETQ